MYDTCRNSLGFSCLTLGNRHHLEAALRYSVGFLCLMLGDRHASTAVWLLSADHNESNNLDFCGPPADARRPSPSEGSTDITRRYSAGFSLLTFGDCHYLISIHFTFENSVGFSCLTF